MKKLVLAASEALISPAHPVEHFRLVSLNYRHVIAQHRVDTDNPIGQVSAALQSPVKPGSRIGVGVTKFEVVGFKGEDRGSKE